MEKRTINIIKSNIDLLRLGFLVVAFMFAYFDTLVSLVKTWSSRNDYSHGFIVPFASLYFVYAMRDKIRTVSIEPNITLGMAVILTGLLVLMLGKTGGMITIQHLSILVVLTGMIIMLLGFAMLKALLLPLGYLVLMIPLIFDVIFSPLHWPFQLFGAKIAALILNALRISVFQTAQFIELPNMSLEVANACSGIRYLVSITALAVPLAYLTLDTWHKRAFLILSSLLIGILANPIRIVIIGLWVYYGGSILHGPGHILQGYFVSVVGFGFLFTAAWIMSRKQAAGRNAEGIRPGQGSRDNADESSIDHEITGRIIHQEENPARRMYNCRRSGRAWACAILIMCSAGIFVNAYSPIPVPLGAPTEQLPLRLEGWTGSNIENPENKIVTLPGRDVEIRVAYSNLSSGVVNLQVGYYEYQRQDKKFVHYTLQKLYDGAKPVRLEIAPTRTIEARQVLLREGRKKHLVTYWYEMGGYSTSSNVIVKCITAWRGLLQWKTNGAIVLLWSDLSTADIDEKTATHQSEFAAAIYSSLHNYLNPR